MKINLFCLTSVLLISALSNAQMKVIQPSQYQFVDGESVVVVPAGTEDLSGTNTLVEVESLDGDGEYVVWMVNESDQDYTTRVIRTEVNVPAGTANTVAWGSYAMPMYAGEMPVWIVGGTSPSFTQSAAPGDTLTSFSFYHSSLGVDGCSHYRIDIVNDDDLTEVLTTFEIIFDHATNSSCVTAIDDLSENVGLNISPNPSIDYFDLTLVGINFPVNVLITDLLGQQVAKHRLVPMESQVERITTSELRNGVYFLSILSKGQVIRTSKFIVSH